MNFNFLRPDRGLNGKRRVQCHGCQMVLTEVSIEVKDLIRLQEYGITEPGTEVCLRYICLS